MQITDAAIFYSRLSKWDEHFAGLPVHVVDAHLYYRLAVEPDTIPGHAHHLVVDVSETIEQKIESILCYQTQFAHKPTIADRIRAAATVTGASAGVAAAESFAAAKPAAIDDLVKTVLR